MTVHLVTVGDSARRFLRDPERRRERIGALWDARGNLRDADELSVGEHPVDEHVPDSVADLLSRIAAGDAHALGVALKVWKASRLAFAGFRASAEATTLKAVTGHHTVLAGDLVMLLASDTGRGLLGAFWNAALILGADFDRVTYLDDPDGDLVSATCDAGARLPPRGGVLVVRIRNLDLGGPKDPALAMRRLGELGRRVLEGLGEAERVDVHLSGGYRATMPFMIGIAEGMRSVAVPGREYPPEVTAYVVHEDSIDAGDPRRIPLPLRRLKLEVLRRELSVFAAGDTASGLCADSLEGYAYDKRGDRWTLTPFGVGFRALIGDASGATG